VRLRYGSLPHLIDVDETATPMEEFCAALDCIVEEAMEDGATYREMVVALAIKAQALGLAAPGFYDDANSEGDEEEVD
jgi:hypothetical protein